MKENDRNKKYLSETICCEKDLSPHNIIQIHSGVGSGKNEFINNVAKGKFFSGQKSKRPRILLITTRKAKVNETLNKENTPFKEKSHDWIFVPENSDCFDEIARWRAIEYNLVCTYAFIEAYLKNRYDPQNPWTHFWNLFDCIVVDEVHGILMDASYQSAPFHVARLITYATQVIEQPKMQHKYVNPRCKHIITMTGTPVNIPNWSVMENAHTIDRFKECVNVMPKNVHFIHKKTAIEQINQQLHNGEKIVYFCNHTITDPISTFDIEPELTPHVAVSFSDKNRRRELEKTNESLYQNMMRTELNISNKEMLPQDVSFFCSTSRNCEGINIKNTDILHLYVESHNETLVKQMSGRIRYGVENLYIIVDEKSYSYEDYDISNEINSALVQPHKENPNGFINQFLKIKCEEFQIEGLYGQALNASRTLHDDECQPIRRYVEYIEKNHPEIQYDYFTNLFRYNPLRVQSIRYQLEQDEFFEEALQKQGGCEMLVQQWFPNAIIHPYEKIEWQGEALIKQYMEKQTVNNGYLEKSEINELTQQLNIIYQKETGEKSLTLGRLLSRLGNYELKQRSHEKSNPFYNHFRIVEKSKTEEKIAG